MALAPGCLLVVLLGRRLWLPGSLQGYRAPGCLLVVLLGRRLWLPGSLQGYRGQVRLTQVVVEV